MKTLHIKLICLLALVLFVVGVSGPSIVSAQTPAGESGEYSTLRQTYRGQLDEYRTADKQYEIALEQHRQLQTLASLEEAVQQTHTAMKLRNEVLISYLQLLKYQLQQATGVNLNQKTRMLEALTTDIANLQAFSVTLASEPDRSLLNQRAAEFSTLSKPLENDAYRVQTMLAVGKLQTIYDKALVLRTEIDAVAATKNDIRNAERQRASQEIKNNLSQAKVIIDELNLDTANTESEFSQSGFSSLQLELTQVYAGLSQSLAYLLELFAI